MTNAHGAYEQCTFPCNDTVGKLCEKTSICNPELTSCANTLKPLRRVSKAVTELSLYIAMFLKVGGTAPLGTILMGKGAKKQKGLIWGEKNTKGAKMLNH